MIAKVNKVVKMVMQARAVQHGFDPTRPPIPAPAIFGGDSSAYHGSQRSSADCGWADFWFDPYLLPVSNGIPGTRVDTVARAPIRVKTGMTDARQATQTA
jgi:hypothetical protein